MTTMAYQNFATTATRSGAGEQQIQSFYQSFDAKIDAKFNRIEAMLQSCIATLEQRSPQADSIGIFPNPNQLKSSTQVSVSSSEQYGNNQLGYRQVVENFDNHEEERFIEIPVFTCVDLRPWIEWMENRFASEEFTELQKLALARGFIDGEAEAYVHRMNSFVPFQSWKDLRESLLWKYGERNKAEQGRHLQMSTTRLIPSINSTNQVQEVEALATVTIQAEEPKMDENLIQDRELDPVTESSQDNNDDHESIVTALNPHLHSETSASLVIGVPRLLIMRRPMVHHRKKMCLAPKSWRFKYKGHLVKKRRLDVVQTILEFQWRELSSSESKLSGELGRMLSGTSGEDLGTVPSVDLMRERAGTKEQSLKLKSGYQKDFPFATHAATESGIQVVFETVLQDIQEPAPCLPKKAELDATLQTSLTLTMNQAKPTRKFNSVSSRLRFVLVSLQSHKEYGLSEVDEAVDSWTRKWCKDWWFNFKQSATVREAFRLQYYRETCYSEQFLMKQKSLSNVVQTWSKQKLMIKNIDVHITCTADQEYDVILHSGNLVLNHYLPCMQIVNFRWTLLVEKLNNDVMIRSNVAEWRTNLGSGHYVLVFFLVLVRLIYTGRHKGHCMKLAQAYNDWSDGRHIPQLTLAESNLEMVNLFCLFCMLHWLPETDAELARLAVFESVLQRPNVYEALSKMCGTLNWQTRKHIDIDATAASSPENVESDIIMQDSVAVIRKHNLDDEKFQVKHRWRIRRCVSRLTRDSIVLQQLYSQLGVKLALAVL